MGTADELKVGETFPEHWDHLLLPGGVKVQVHFVDQYDAFDFSDIAFPVHGPQASSGLSPNPGRQAGFI
jgi:hypothetical protein